MKSILTKLGAARRTAAIAIAQRRGIATPIAFNLPLVSTRTRGDARARSRHVMQSNAGVNP